MKKLYTAVILFAATLVAVAVWYSPLYAVGEPRGYENNIEIAQYGGVCYPSDANVCTRFSGGENELYSALDKICAKEVKSVRTQDMLFVYAFSPRVGAKPQRTEDGKVYNVMAAVGENGVAIGTPVLQGCY